jgi:PAS domain S-box-containing protein
MPLKSKIKNLKTNRSGFKIDFAAITEKSLVGIYLIQDEIFKYINPKFAEIFEYTIDELLNKKGPKDLAFPGDWDKVSNNISKRLKGEVESIDYEFKGLTKNNRFIIVKTFGSRTVYDGKPAVLGTLLDITEHDETLNELNRSEKKFKDLVEMLPQMIFEIDSEIKITFANKSVTEILGYTLDELEKGKSFLQLIVPSEREKASIDIAEVLNGKTLHNRGYQILKKDGSSFVAEISASPIHSEDGIITGARSFIIDKSETINSEKQLRILSRAVQQSIAGIIITDFDGSIEYVNPKFEQITGYTLAEIAGKNPRILSSKLKPHSEYENLWKNIKSGKDWAGEFQNKKKNGELYWASTIISPVKDNEGKITHFLGLQEDITQRKKTEGELIAAKEKAEEMNRLKSVFLANMSHELRTPMIGILGFAETLHEELDNPVLKEMAAVLLQSGNRLKETLNLILDLSRIESKELDINLEVHNIPEILKEIINVFEAISSQKGLKLYLVIENEDITTFLDKRMFVQVIENLVNNAIKYTDSGNVTINVKNKFENDDKFAIIEVTDSGIGISEKNLKMIFDPFRQVSEGYARNFEGTGLGLTITKKYIELLNGEIFVESKLGIGSKFTIKFPSAKPHKDFGRYNNNMNDLKESFHGNKKQKYNLLLVENDKPSVDIIRLYLQNDYIVDYAVDGLSALESIKKKKYSAVLMDIDLGLGMNGIEVTQKIKKIPGYENVPIIAVTAYAMLGDREKFLSAGCTHYLSKPFDKSAIISLLQEIL